GLVRERHRQDPFWVDAVPDQVRDPERDDARFAGAGSGEHQQRSGQSGHRLLLSGIEFSQTVHARPSLSRAGLWGGTRRRSFFLDLDAGDEVIVVVVVQTEHRLIMVITAERLLINA